MTTVGSIGDLQPGAHACMTFTEEDERLDLMAAFVQIDADHADALAQALTEAIRLDDNVFLNLRGLRFMDMASASTVVRAALSLPADRILTVVGNEHLKMVLELAGAREASQLRIQVSHVQP